MPKKKKRQKTRPDRIVRRRAQRAAQRFKTRSCEVCGEQFETTRIDTVTCSNACRQKFWRLRHPSLRNLALNRPDLKRAIEQRARARARNR